jgi:hypothetical protein
MNLSRLDLQLKRTLDLILLESSVVRAVRLRMIVQVLLEFGTQGMLGVVLVARTVVVIRHIKTVLVTPIVTKISLFADSKDTVLENNHLKII